MPWTNLETSLDRRNVLVERKRVVARVGDFRRGYNHGGANNSRGSAINLGLLKKKALSKTLSKGERSQRHSGRKDILDLTGERAVLGTAKPGIPRGGIWGLKVSPSMGGLGRGRTPGGGSLIWG